MIASQFSHLTLHLFSNPFEQFSAFANNLAIVVFPVPLIPVNKYAFGILLALIELIIVSTITSWPIKSSKYLRVYILKLAL